MEKSIFVVYRIVENDVEMHLFSAYVEAKYFVKTHKEKDYSIWEKVIEK